MFYKCPTVCIVSTEEITNELYMKCHDSLLCLFTLLI